MYGMSRCMLVYVSACMCVSLSLVRWGCLIISMMVIMSMMVPVLYGSSGNLLVWNGEIRFHWLQNFFHDNRTKKFAVLYATVAMQRNTCRSMHLARKGVRMF